ncbi:MAG: SUMF1/EgtB/PvdO family nonheme iron enzyme [Herpetosiphonaceae bacterium]|nr:SUMF1/EgtB/PvdO family nonheme iron enzyme [Herpetosiphonaceae bacterium]
MGGSRRKRGGSWNNNPINLRAANRNNNSPDNRNNNVGFRLATHPACPAKCHIATCEVVPPNLERCELRSRSWRCPAKEPRAVLGPVAHVNIRARRNLSPFHVQDKRDDG